MATTPLWTLKDVAALYGAALSLSDNPAIQDLNLDSRHLAPGSLFLAYRRPTGKDGHDFLDDARDQGAVAAIIERDAVCDGLPLIRVDDTNHALQVIGQAGRQRVNPQCKIVAITGSVGKTTCRALTAQALSIFGNLHASAHSLNNHWGVPLSLARMPRDTDYGVFEVGMNHADEITPLTYQIRPHVAIITTIDAVHIGNFADGIEGITRAKAEIFAGVEPGGAAVLNADLPQFDALADAAKRHGIDRIITFSQNGPADLRLVAYERRDEGGQVTAHIAGTEVSFHLPLRGAHNAMNALAALGAVHALGLDVAQAAQAFATLSNVAGRGNLRRFALPGHGTVTIIDDQHNASPVSLHAAIREFAHMHVTGRRVLALGDMRELGDESPALHRAVAPVIAESKIDLVLTCGPLMQHLAAILPPAHTHHYADSQGLADDIINHLHDGDAVLLKASRSVQMNHVVDALNRIGQTVG